MSSYPYVQTSSVFNTNDYNVLDTGLTIETANMLYLSLSGGVISGSLNVGGNLDCGTLTVGGLSLNIGAITGVTPGTISASKAAIVDANKDISGFRRLSVGGTTGIMQINALTGGDSAIRLGSSENVNKCWTIQYLTATNLLRFDAFGSNSSISLTPAGDLTSKASFDTLAYKLNGVAITMSALTSITLGTAAASKVLTLDASSNITGINSLTTSGIITTSYTNNTASLLDYQVWTNSVGTPISVNLQMSSSNPKFGTTSAHSMRIFTNNTVGLWMDTSQNVAISSSAPSGSYKFEVNGNSQLNGTLTSSSTTTSSSNTTGALTLSGGIGISNTTDASSITNGGTFTTAGGAAIAKKLYTGDSITSAGQIFCTKAGQGFNHTDSTVSLVSYVNAGFANVGYFGTITASDLYLQANNITQLTIGSSGICRFINTTDSTASGNGSVIFSGGVGIAKKVFSASTITGLNLISSNSYATSGVSTKVASLYGHQAFGSINTNGSYVSAGISFLNASADQMPQASIVLDRKALDQGDLCIYTQSPSLNLSETARFLSTGALSINTGSNPIAMISCIGSGSYLYGTQYQRLLHLESNHATPVKFEVSLNKNTAATTTNECLLGTTTANDLYIGTDSTYRMCIKATTNYVGIGDNASSIDKVFGILNGTIGSSVVDMRFGNGLSTNNCFTMTYTPTSSGSGLNRLQFDPYGSSGALTILAKKYVGIGTTGPVCPLDVAGYDSGLGILAAYQYAGATSGDGGYIASGTTTGVNINARFQDNVIFDQKIYIRSDRRVKKDIIPLTVDLGIKFVEEVDPVLFRKKDQSSDAMMEIGYIAQDIMKAGFGNIITHTDNDNMRIEEEGDIENIQFNVDYSRVCAILHSVIKEQQKRIDELESNFESILDELKTISSCQNLDILNL